MLYELTCLINPDLKEDEIIGFVQKLEDQLNKEGKVIRKEPPKKIRLSYPIKKQLSAFLLSVEFEVSPEKTGLLKSEFDRAPQILRFLFVKTKAPTEQQPSLAKPKKKTEAEKEKTETSGPPEEEKPKKREILQQEEGPKKEKKPPKTKAAETTKKVEMEKIEEDLEKIIDFPEIYKP